MYCSHFKKLNVKLETYLRQKLEFQMRNHLLIKIFVKVEVSEFHYLSLKYIYIVWNYKLDKAKRSFRMDGNPQN